MNNLILSVSSLPQDSSEGSNIVFECKDMQELDRFRQELEYLVNKFVLDSGAENGEFQSFGFMNRNVVDEDPKGPWLKEICEKLDDLDLRYNPQVLKRKDLGELQKFEKILTKFKHINGLR